MYLTIPSTGLDLLEWLAAGETVGEAVRRYEQKHGETPDIDDFLDALAAERVIAPAVTAAPNGATPEPAGRRPAKWSRLWNLEGVSQRTAQRILSTPVLVACGLVVVVAIAMVIDDPSVLPGPGSLLYPRDFAAFTWATFSIAGIALFVHELAHVLGAKAAGVSSRLEIGNQMYVVVVHTDMTGIWLAPKRQRYLAFLIGPAADVLSSAILLGVLWTHHRGFVSLSETAYLLISGVIYTYFIRLLFQCFMYLRTDFYYTIAAAFDCKNLMRDTEVLIQNLVRRLVGRRSTIVDQSGIPPRERRAIRAYSLFWLAGRGFAIAALVFLIIPVLFGFIVHSWRFLVGDPATTFGLVDFLTVLFFIGLVEGGGLYLWLRQLYRGRRKLRGYTGSLVQGQQSGAAVQAAVRP